MRELLNGCICCNLVGQLSDALAQLRDEVRPDRIVIETSGSAFPATLAMEVKRLGREGLQSQGQGQEQGQGQGDFVLDGVISVIDVENWEGYEDTSYTAKIQAKYTDLIIFNKWEDAPEMRFDVCLDRVGDLEVETPWVKTDKGWVDKDVLLGIDGALLSKAGDDLDLKSLSSPSGVHGHGHEHEHEHKHDHQSEVEVLSVLLKSSTTTPSDAIDTTPLQTLLRKAPKEEIYRIKAILRTPSSNPPFPSSEHLEAAEEKATSQPNDYQTTTSTSTTTNPTQHHILNWAFGRWTFTPSETVPSDPAVVARFTLILARYESAKWKRRIEEGGFLRVLGGDRKGEVVVERVV